MTRSPVRIALLAAALLAAGSWSSRAAASDSLAESLYQEGRRAAQSKNWDLACRKFRESHEREPAPGTLLNLADCEEKRGQLVDSFTHFDGASKQFRDERAPWARERAAALDKRIPRLRLHLEPGTPVGTTIERDGKLVDPSSLGLPVPIDPGEHTLVVHAPGHVPVTRIVHLAEGDNQAIELAAATAASEAAPTEAPPPHAHAPPPPRETPASRRETTLRVAGFASLGAGAAALGVGIVTGILTLDAKNTVETHCPAAGCDAAGLDAQDDGKTMSAVSTVGFVTAAVAAGAGAGLLYFARDAKRSGAGVALLTASPLPGGTAIGLAGRF